MTPDNRVVYMPIAGHQFPLCLTVHAQEMFHQQFGSYDGWLQALQSGGDMAAIDATAELIYILMQGGRSRIRVLAKLAGEEPVLPADLTKEEVRELLAVPELNGIQSILLQAFSAGNSTTVEVEEDQSKNAGTTLV